MNLESDSRVSARSSMGTSTEHRDYNESPRIGSNQSIPFVTEGSTNNGIQVDDLFCHEEMVDLEPVPPTSSHVHSACNSHSEGAAPCSKPIDLVEIEPSKRKSLKNSMLAPLIPNDENEVSVSEDGNLLCNEDISPSDAEEKTTPPEIDDRSSKKSASSFSHETLDLISQYLRNDMIVDELDEDEIVDIIKVMNKASARRRKQRSIILNHSRKTGSLSSDEEVEDDWRDDEIYQRSHIKEKTCDPNQLAINAMINIVDFEFFHETITNVTKKKIKDNQASKLSTRSMQKRPLDASTISMLRNSLGVVVPTRKGKRNRKFLVDDSDSLLSSEMHQKLKGRGPSKGPKHGYEYETDHIGDLSTLIGAMIDLEEAEGRDGIANFKEPVRRSGRSRSPKNSSDTLSQHKNGRKRRLFQNNEPLFAEIAVVKKGRGRIAKKSAYTKRIEVQILVDGSPFVRAKKESPEKKNDVKTKKAKQRRLLPTQVILFNLDAGFHLQIEPILNSFQSFKTQGTTFFTEDYAPLMPETKKLKRTVTDIQKKQVKNTRNRVKIKDKDPLYRHFIECCEDDIKSVSLLDWRRRQQENLPEVNSMSTLKDVFDTTLLSWERNKKVERSTSVQTAGLEPARQKHSNLLYGGWCNKLISCLQGSGRMMARHEFFYSDIDKAWFNANPYFQDLAAIGIPSDIRLTSSEWSFVRRRLRKKTRRFSRSFIISQLKQLDKYRYTVRTIQNGHATEEMKRNFRYDGNYLTFFFLFIHIYVLMYFT